MQIIFSTRSRNHKWMQRRVCTYKTPGINFLWKGEVLLLNFLSYQQEPVSQKAQQALSFLMRMNHHLQNTCNQLAVRWKWKDIMCGATAPLKAMMERSIFSFPGGIPKKEWEAG